MLPEFAQRLVDAFAGFCGSVVYAVRFPLPTASQTVVVVLIGTLSAHFLTSDVARATTLSPGASGFLIGFGSYRLSAFVLDWMVSYISRWRKQ